MITLSDIKKVSKLTEAELLALPTKEKQVLRGKVIDRRNELRRKRWSSSW